MPTITFSPVANFGEHPLSNVKKVGDLKKCMAFSEYLNFITPNIE